MFTLLSHIHSIEQIIINKISIIKINIVESTTTNMKFHFKTRYETKCFQRNLSPIAQKMAVPTEDLAELSINSGITKSVSTSKHTSSTSFQRITGRQTVTSSFNSSIQPPN